MVSNRRKLELLLEARYRKARTCFLTFRQVINPKAKWGWWQREVAEVLQQFEADLMAGKRPKLVIQAPPQHGKSVQIVDLIAWIAGRHPELRTIYASFSDRLGLRANLKLQRIFSSEAYQRIFPDVIRLGTPGSGVQRTQNFMEYGGQDGYFRNTTVRGSVTGESLDLGVVDDPIKGRADANSDTVRDAAWDWFTDDFFSRFSEDAGLLIILTRWHIDDPVGRLVDRYPDVIVKSYAAIAEEDEPHRKAGEALFPEHKSLSFLLERKAIMDSANWLALYQQRPTAKAGQVFKPDMIGVLEAVPADAIDVGWVRGWDMASSDGKKSDYTVGARLARRPNGRFIISDVVRGQWITHERDEAIKNAAARDGSGTTQDLPQDPAAAGKAQVHYLVTQALAGHSVSWSLESGDKVLRAEPFASQVNVGNVDMVRGDWNAKFVDELRTFPNGANDDQVDAASRAFNKLMGGNLGMLEWMRQQAGEG
jgi:predicted phage terminase large subunit-like protein